MKDFSFSRYLRIEKSSKTNAMMALGLSAGNPQKVEEKQKQTVWSSGKKIKTDPITGQEFWTPGSQGTYVKAVHGELSRKAA